MDRIKVKSKKMTTLRKTQQDTACQNVAPSADVHSVYMMYKKIQTILKILKMLFYFAGMAGYKGECMEIRVISARTSTSINPSMNN